MEDETVENKSESISGTMEDVLQPSNQRFSTEDRLKMCCRPSYQMRRVKNKGAILILVWNHLVLSVFCYLNLYPHTFRPNWHMYSIGYGLSLPIAGWLADVCLGRYKIIRWSILIMWIASVLVVAGSILSQFVESYCYINKNYVTTVLLLMICIAFGAYQANIVLFGTDQLQDASTDEITSFISWYVCTWFGGMAISYFIPLCLAGIYDRLLEELTICICLTLIVILAITFDKVFLKEPITQNPFRLICKVIKYAVKTKHPRCRSAFTYCEDELPSRMDLGKRKYGGPFTTEEVENVKTFLRLLLIIFVGSVVSSGIINFNIVYEIVLKNHQEDTSHYHGFHKSSWMINVDLAYFSGAVLVALYEFIFYPLVRKFLSCIQSYQWKLSFGVVSQMARVMALMAIDLIARHNYIIHNNSTIQCIFMEEGGILSSNFNMKWMILPRLLHSTSLIALATGAFEFICSQSPYSMRGLLFGAMYGSVVLYRVIGFRIFKSFTKQSIVWGAGLLSCEFWYLLLILLFLMVYTIMLCILMKWYKNRKREDILPNEQIFAERYYTKY